MNMSFIKNALTGAEASAEAMRQINPDVCAAYPITPQTPVMMKFAQYIADGVIDTELIRVESEHSAMSACVGSAISGARTMTATSANGLALMWEIVYIAAGYRLPIVMNVVNRSLGAPINIHCDHSDSMGCRDSGWLQIYCEDAQEAYDNTIMAVRIAEHPDVMLPVMVCQDGFITSHTVDVVNILDDKTVTKFIGDYKPAYDILNIKNPFTIGAIVFYDYYFEIKRQQFEAMEKSKEVIQKIFKEFSKITGRKYDFFEEYMMDDAEVAIVTMNSTAGTTKYVIDELRKQGKKVGLLKVVVFRPFMSTEIVEKLKNLKAIAILERTFSGGALGCPLFNEIRSAFHEHMSKDNSNAKPKIINYIFGLGGREINPTLITQVFTDLEQIKETGETGELVKYLGVRD